MLTKLGAHFSNQHSHPKPQATSQVKETLQQLGEPDCWVGWIANEAAPPNEANLLLREATSKTEATSETQVCLFRLLFRSRTPLEGVVLQIPPRSPARSMVDDSK